MARQVRHHYAVEWGGIDDDSDLFGVSLCQKIPLSQLKKNQIIKSDFFCLEDGSLVQGTDVFWQDTDVFVG